MKLIIAFLFSLSFLMNFNVYAADATAGQTKYTAVCASCHGPAGKGDGPAAVALDPKPADLSTTQLDDAGLANVIKNGGVAIGKSALMVGFAGTLSDAEIENIIAYLKTLK